jgi:hypothetical protein
LRTDISRAHFVIGQPSTKYAKPSVRYTLGSAAYASVDALMTNGGGA